MKKTAVFINTGRGPTVQEVALIKALEEVDRPRRSGRAGDRAAGKQQPIAGDAKRDAERAHSVSVLSV